MAKVKIKMVRTDNRITVYARKSDLLITRQVLVREYHLEPPSLVILGLILQSILR